jgi:membrane-associated phospholipid phosphatase
MTRNQLPLFFLMAFFVSDAPAMQADSVSGSGASEDARDRVYYPDDTENIKPLARKLAGNVLLDQKAIWTSPFHMSRRNAVKWLGLGAITATLIATDIHTSRVLENSQGQVRWAGNVSRVGAAYTVVPVAAGFYAWGAAFKNDKARETGVLGAEAMLDGIIVVEIMKPIAGRARPDNRDGGEFLENGSGFPSGHAIESWALASVIAHEYHDSRFVPALAYGLAAVVGGARVAARQHYASDVFAGSAMGWFIGRYVYQTHQEHSGHRHGSLMPLVQPSTNTYGLALRLNP